LVPFLNKKLPVEWPEDIFSSIPDVREAPEEEFPERKPERIREIYLSGITYKERPTEVCAMFALPEQCTEPVPAVILVHGGGGTAFYEWVTLWNQRGYAAIALDLSGQRPAKDQNGYEYKVAPSPSGGPGGCETGIIDCDKTDIRDHWIYHAVAAISRTFNYLASLPEIKSDCIGLIGISWGAFTSIIAAGVDHRFQFLCATYGCGFLAEDSMWAEERKNDADWHEFIRLYDPAHYAPFITMPALFANSTNDPCFPVISWEKTIDLIKLASVRRVLKLDLFHSYPPEGDPPEIRFFADACNNRHHQLPLADETKSEGTYFSSIINGVCQRAELLL